MIPKWTRNLVETSPLNSRLVPSTFSSTPPLNWTLRLLFPPNPTLQSQPCCILSPISQESALPFLAAQVYQEVTLVCLLLNPFTNPPTNPAAYLWSTSRAPPPLPPPLIQARSNHHHCYPGLLQLLPKLSLLLKPWCSVNSPYGIHSESSKT